MAEGRPGTSGSQFPRRRGQPDREARGQSRSVGEETLIPGRRVVVVGLTGSIGAGKSTALSLFGRLGALTLSADDLVHDLYQRVDLKVVLVDRFGPSVLDPQGEVDRLRLAEAIRGEPQRLRWLEEATHPLVAAELQRLVREASPGRVVVCEVPLLFESGSERFFDLIVTIEASGENRRARSVHRFSRDVFDELEELQASTERRVAGSDMVFFNDGAIGELEAFVGKAYERASRLLERT